jgi:hypothetical protein
LLIESRAEYPGCVELAGLMRISFKLAVMSDEMNTILWKSDLLSSSLLVRCFAAQREEILRHKWYESEKAGHDIGFDRAQTDWTLKHRSKWLRTWQVQQRAN